MGVKLKDKKAMRMKYNSKMKLWKSEIIVETPPPKIKICITQEFGWASGKLRWCAVVLKDKEISAKYPFETEKEARLQAVVLCYNAENFGVTYETTIKLGVSPKERGRE